MPCEGLGCGGKDWGPMPSGRGGPIGNPEAPGGGIINCSGGRE